jgi:CDP-diacylglycerol--glycerol-3-phosphate 3-phosphatidyltransferase
MLKLIPNILTFGRLVLTIIFLIMILYAPPRYAQGELPFPDFLDIAFILFVVAGLTDMIDGTVARKLNVASKFGRMVDPLADKILVCGSFICFAIIGEPKLFNFGPVVLSIIHWSVAGILIAREVYVTVLRHIAEARGISFAATVSGKIKMFVQSFAIGTVIIKMAHAQTATWGYWFTTVTFAIMLVVTVISGLRATQRSCWKTAAKSQQPASA